MKYCDSFCRDLDLLRQDLSSDQDQESSLLAVVPPCPRCGVSVDMSFLEQRFAFNLLYYEIVIHDISERKLAINDISQIHFELSLVLRYF